jgi:hypothetical protein
MWSKCGWILMYVIINSITCSVYNNCIENQLKLLWVSRYANGPSRNVRIYKIGI